MDICSDSEEIVRHPRSIVHLDVDCFYAQVEMLRHPELDGRPLGVQQKNIVVTSNYMARQFGVGKCISVQEALRLCPGLALVRGEDLTEYRRISTKISEILHQFTPLVERLGMDESFVDVSSMVDDYAIARLDNDCRMKDDSFQESDSENYASDDESRQVIGNIFGASEEECPCGCHSRLAAASRIAAAMRARIFKELGITCSAGIGHNKLVAKMVGSLHKPNQQTLVYPCSAPALMTKIGPVSKIPGIGTKTTQLLATNNIKTVEDVRRMSMDDLESKIGSELARKLKDSAEGIDDSIVKPSGKPQSIGIEDGFKHVSLVDEVELRLGALLRRLTDLATEDGRIPVAMKVTVRKHDLNKPSTGKRETRQCALPHTLLPSTRGGVYDHAKMLVLAMKLFHRAVDVAKPFHLTLLGVAFTKFEERVSGRSSITSFLRKQVAVQSVLDISSEEGVSELGSVQTTTSVSTAISSTATTTTAGTGEMADIGEDVQMNKLDLWLSPDVDKIAVSPLTVHGLMTSSISTVSLTDRYHNRNHQPHRQNHNHHRRHNILHNHHHRHRSPSPPHHHSHDDRLQQQSQECHYLSPDEDDVPDEVEPSPKKTKLEVWLSGRRESPSNEMASLRLGPSSPMSPMSPVSPPPGTDSTVFKSLPIELQTEIGRTWPTTSKPKPNDILKYFIANK